MENKIKHWQLKQRQSLPLEAKIIFAQTRIREWYEYWEGEVYIAFSGGKDSTVLLHLVRELYPNIPAVFVDTGLEYPEIRDFVKTIDNVVWLKPKKTFKQVLGESGFPVVSKAVAHKLRCLQNPTSKNKLNTAIIMGQVEGKTMGRLPKKWMFLKDAPFNISDACCDVFKKYPMQSYERGSGKKQYLGTMAYESRDRERSYLRRGCNSFEGKQPFSRPLAIWTEDNIWDYIHKYNLLYSKIYNMGHDRTGCMFCMFGLQKEEIGNTRFDRMRIQHPNLYKYCMDELGLREVIDFVNRQKDLFSKVD